MIPAPFDEPVMTDNKSLNTQQLDSGARPVGTPTETHSLKWMRRELVLVCQEHPHLRDMGYCSNCPSSHMGRLTLGVPHSVPAVQSPFRTSRGSTSPLTSGRHCSGRKRNRATQLGDCIMIYRVPRYCTLSAHD